MEKEDARVALLLMEITEPKEHSSRTLTQSPLLMDDRRLTVLPNFEDCAMLSIAGIYKVDLRETNDPHSK
jgi:hypothetical protein